MEDTEKDLRVITRSYVEPYDTGTYLEIRLDGKSYRFNLLDTSPDGMGMLVKEEQSEILKNLKINDRIRTEYKTTEASMTMDFAIRHITQIERGKYKGHHQVGLSLLSDAG